MTKDWKEFFSYIMGFLICGGFGWTFILIGMGVIPGAWYKDDMIIITETPLGCSALHCFTVQHDNYGNCTVYENTDDYAVGEIHEVYYQGSAPVYSDCTFDDKITTGVYILVGLIPTIISCLMLLVCICCIPYIYCSQDESPQSTNNTHQNIRKTVIDMV
jgi:hypothetical protein